MAVTTECTLSVPLVDFRRAVAAVKPHAERTKTGDEVNAYGRVRFIADKTELLVLATNGVTAAMAAVEILDDSRKERFAADDGVFSLDMSPILAGDLRSGLRIMRAEQDEDSQTAELVMTDESMTVRDVSGLWPGSATTRPTLPVDVGSAEFPNVRDMLKRAMGAAGEAVKPLTAKGEALALFNAAARQYGKPLQFEASGPSASRAYIVWCGPRFVGMVSSGHDDDDSLARRQSERRAHLERLGLTKALVDL